MSLLKVIIQLTIFLNVTFVKVQRKQPVLFFIWIKEPLSLRMCRVETTIENVNQNNLSFVQRRRKYPLEYQQMLHFVQHANGFFTALRMTMGYFPSFRMTLSNFSKFSLSFTAVKKSFTYIEGDRRKINFTFAPHFSTLNATLYISYCL